jgi:hypothetical protein
VIELIAIATLPTIIIALTGLLTKEKLLTKNLAGKVIQLTIDNKIILDNIQDKPFENNIEQTEGFVTFLSESREWAFEYIENVQSGLNKFVEQAGPRLEYFDKYGRVIPSPHNDGLEDILTAYRELQKLLPETNNKEK